MITVFVFALFRYNQGYYYRSSRLEVFCKKGVLRNFAKFTGKHLCQSLFFNKVACLRPATLLKMRLWHRCFLVNFAKFLRTSFLQNISSSCFCYYQDVLLIVIINCFIGFLKDNFIKCHIFGTRTRGSLVSFSRELFLRRLGNVFSSLMYKIPKSLMNILARPMVDTLAWPLVNMLVKSQGKCWHGH